MHAVCSQESGERDFPFWCFDNYCGLEEPLSEEEIRDLYEQIAGDPAKIREFLTRFGEMYRKNMSEKDTICVAFDSAGSSTTPGNNELAVRKHADQNENIPQMNVALFTDQVTGIPIFYEEFVGSALDRTETPYTPEKAITLGFERLFVMMDNYSAQAASALVNRGLDFGVMAPNDEKAVRMITGTYGSAITRNVEYCILEEDVHGIHVAPVEALGGTYHAYLFHDPELDDYTRAVIHDRLAFMRRKLLEHKSYTQSLATRYAPWLMVEKKPVDWTGRDFRVQENVEKVQDIISGAGYSVILSNAELTPEVMMHIACARDFTKESFEHMKSHFGITNSRIHNTWTCRANMFMTFLSLAIKESYRWFVRTPFHSESSKAVATSLGELRKYKIHGKTDGKWAPSYALTSQQKGIFRVLGVTAANLEASARAVRIPV